MASGFPIIFGGSRLWTPAEIGTVLWLDAADATTVRLNSGNVSQWRDKSGNGYHASQSTAAAQPAYDVAGWKSSRPAVVFNQHYLENTSAFATFPLQTRSVFIVVNEVTRIGNGGIFVARPSGTTDFNAQDACVWTTGDGSTTQFDVAGSTSTSYRLNAPPSLPSSGMFTEIKSTGQGSLYKNGTFLLSDTSFTEFNLFSFGGYWLAARQEATFNYLTRGFRGQLAEIIYIGTNLSTADRQKIEGYLAWKWALADDLPSDHPFKNAPPTI